MWKLFKRLKEGVGTGSERGSVASGSSSVADLRGKFILEKHCTHGFPLGPSCMTFDIHRRVLFIGTTSGELRMLGYPGVELTGMHDNIAKVVQILPFASEPSVITVSTNNLMHKWSLVDHDGNSRLVLKRTYKFQGGLAKTITVCCLSPHCDCLFVGTLGGITYPMDTDFDGMSPEVLSWSRARAYLNIKSKDIPGEVRSLEISPTNPKQLLIGYEHSYLELWDALTWKPISVFGPYKDAGDILDLSWHSSGQRFVTSHRNGSVAHWNVDQPAQPYLVKQLHDEPCQEISKVLWPSDDLLVMSGGAPLDQVDGYSVSIVPEKQDPITLQVTSGVRGMHVIEDTQSDRDSGIVNAGSDTENSASTTVRKVLVLLLEQEILFVDLRLPDLPLLQPPYLHSIHNSPVKCVQVQSEVEREVWQTIAQIGRVQQEAIYRASNKVWPIDGGVLEEVPHDRRDMLITGHEDGSVKFWDISEASMQLLYKVNSMDFFNSLDTHFLNGDTSDQEQPRQEPRQFGFWDPRSDDDNLIVTTVHYDDELLIVGFQGGLALLFTINNQSANVSIELIRVSIMRDDPRQRGRNWQAPLDVRTDSIECGPGFQPTHCISLFPNVAVTVIGAAKNQQLLGVGCIYGFTIIDYLKNTTVHVHCTYEQTVPDAGQLSRMQSIRRSFRQSLKRFNVRQSMRGGQSTSRSYRPNLLRSGSTRPSVVRSQRGAARATTTGASKGATPVAAETAPLKRDTIRTITFTAPCHVGGHSSTYNVLVGTNQGSLLAYTIDMPSSKHRDMRSPVVMPIDREFNAKKNQAVVFAGVIDGHNYLLDINDSGSFHAKGGQYIVICTEDTLKVAGLPHMKKKFRVKLKQHDDDDFHIVSAHYLRIAGQSGMILMDSDGYNSIYSLPDLKLLYREVCVDGSDAMGQRHFVCSRQGVLLHQRSPSEFTHGSLTEEARMEFHFTLPSKHIVPLALSQPQVEENVFVELEPMSPVDLLPNGGNEGEEDIEETDRQSESEEFSRSPLSPEMLAFQERAL